MRVLRENRRAIPTRNPHSTMTILAREFRSVVLQWTMTMYAIEPVDKTDHVPITSKSNTVTFDVIRNIA